MDKYKQTVATFDKFANQYQEKYMAHEAYVDTYKQFLSLFTPQHQSVLDVACGPGNIAKFLLSHHSYLDITGIDLSPSMIELARVNCPSANFEIKDSRDINSITKQFDVIIAGFCFPYLSKPDILDFLNSAQYLLNNKGLMYISTMEDSEERSGYNGDSKDRVYTYYHQFDFLEKSLQLNHFNIVKVIRKPVIASDDIEDTAKDLFLFATKKPH